MRLILVISVSCVWLFTSNYLCTISRHPSTWYESLAQDVAHVHWSTEYSIASGAFNQPMHQTTKYCKAHIYLWCYGHFPRPQNIYFTYEDKLPTYDRCQIYNMSVAEGWKLMQFMLHSYMYLGTSQRHLGDGCMSIRQFHCEDTPTHFPHYQYNSDHWCG